MNTSHTPAEPLKFTCPRCNQTVTATDGQAGTRTQCPHCQQTIKVPGTPSSPINTGRQGRVQVVTRGGAQTRELTLVCTHCQTPLQAHLDQVGQTITCSDCLESILVEPPSSTAPSEPPVQAADESQNPQQPSSVAVQPDAGPPPDRQSGSDASESDTSESDASPDADDFDDYSLEELDTQPWQSTPAAAKTRRDESATSAEADDDEYKLADLDETPPPAKTNIPENDSRIISIGEEAEEEIVAMEAVNKPSSRQPPAPVTPDSNAVTEVNPNEEFGILCRLCGTRIYVRIRDVGQEVKCPDCHSQNLIDKPKTARRKRPTTDHTESDHLDLVKLQPETEVARPENQEMRKMAQQTLQQAREKKPTYFKEEQPGLEVETPPIVLLKFLLNPHTIGYWVILSVGVTILASCFYFAINPPGQDLNASIAKVIWVSFWILTSVSGCLAIGFLSVTLLTIAGETTNGTLNIEHWPPVTGFLDWALDTLYVVNSAVIAALPGAIIAAPLIFFEVPMWISLVPVALSVSVLFSILFASMLENRSCFNPVALPIWRSLKANTSCWTMFYMAGPIMLIGAYAIGCGYAFGSILANGFISAGIVGLLFVYFRLLGWVIWKVREQIATEE